MDSGSSPGHWRHSPAPPWEGRGRCSARPQSAGEAHGFPTRSADRDLSGPPWGPGEGTRGRPGPLPGRRVWLRPRSRVWRFRSLTGSPAGSVGRGPEFEPPAGTRGQSYGRPAARRSEGSEVPCSGSVQTAQRGCRGGELTGSAPGRRPWTSTEMPVCPGGPALARSPLGEAEAEAHLFALRALSGPGGGLRVWSPTWRTRT